MKNLKKWSMNLVVLCVTTMLFAGCGGGGGSSSPPAPTTGNLKIVNASLSGYTIDKAYASLSSSGTWGPQQNSSAIAAGSSLTLSGLTAGTYDAYIVSYGAISTYYAYNYGFPITVGNTYTLTATDASYTGSLIVYNTNATYPITALYISTSGDAGGTNVLSTSIAPGTSSQIVNILSGTYYVQAIQNGIARNNYPVSIPSHGYITLTYN